MNTFAESENLYKSSMLEEEDGEEDVAEQEVDHALARGGKRARPFNIDARRKVEEYFENKRLEQLTRDSLFDPQ